MFSVQTIYFNRWTTRKNVEILFYILLNWWTRKRVAEGYALKIVTETSDQELRDIKMSTNRWALLIAWFLKHFVQGASCAMILHVFQYNGNYQVNVKIGLVSANSAVGWESVSVISILLTYPLRLFYTCTFLTAPKTWYSYKWITLTVHEG